MTPSHPTPGSSIGMEIAACGTYLPSRILTNADLEKRVDTSDEWIMTRTGIRERRVASKEETASEMGARAAQQALERSGIKAEEIDLILCATSTPDAYLPSTACFIQDKIGASNAWGFDLSAACSGFVYGLVTANHFICNGGAKTVLVVGTERMGSMLDWTDRNTCVLFGDGAGAMIVRAKEGAAGLLSSNLGSSGTYHAMLHYMNPFSNRDLESPANAAVDPSYLFMAGKEVFKRAVNAMVKSANNTLEQAGCTIDDIRCVITHQANMRIIDAVRDKLKVPEERCFINVQRYGNISAACIPVALQEAETHYPLQRGDKILLVAFGGGLTWGSCLIQW